MFKIHFITIGNRIKVKIWFNPQIPFAHISTSFELNSYFSRLFENFYNSYRWNVENIKFGSLLEFWTPF
jgi:hypothetical protein